MSNSPTIWLLTIPCVIAVAFIYHRRRLKKAYHQKKECQSRTLELEALLYHSKQLLVKLNHEIRTPLNGVTGLTSMLQETSLSEEQREYVESIRSCSVNMMKALNHTFQSAGIANNKETDKKPGAEQKEERLLAPSVKLSAEFATHYPLRILVAEDDQMNQQLAVMILKRLGYTADIAPNGKEVLEMVSEKKYDLILMDIQMPEMDGMEATRMIRLCLNSQPIIIAMTANAMDGDKEACLAAGMEDYISKPVNINELVEKLEKWALTLTPLKENP